MFWIKIKKQKNVLLCVLDWRPLNCASMHMHCTWFESWSIWRKKKTLGNPQIQASKTQVRSVFLMLKTPVINLRFLCLYRNFVLCDVIARVTFYAASSIGQPFCLKRAPWLCFLWNKGENVDFSPSVGLCDAAHRSELPSFYGWASWKINSAHKMRVVRSKTTRHCSPCLDFDSVINWSFSSMSWSCLHNNPFCLCLIRSKLYSLLSKLHHFYTTLAEKHAGL